VRKQLFHDVGKGRSFRIGFGRIRDEIDRIHVAYDDVPHGERVAFFGANGLLQIAVNKGAEGSGGGAARLFGVHEGDPVRVEFGERVRR
jgi:S-adenosylmethionine hydrolase